MENKQLLRFIKSKKGVSLMGVMVAASIMIGVLLTAPTMLNNVFKYFKKAESNQTKVLALTNITTFLADSIKLIPKHQGESTDECIDTSGKSMMKGGNCKNTTTLCMTGARIELLSSSQHVPCATQGVVEITRHSDDIPELYNLKIMLKDVDGDARIYYAVISDT